MSLPTSSLPANPFNYQISSQPMSFSGRHKELETISDYLRGDSPHCCVIIGESYIGKTSLLRYLVHPQAATVRDSLGIGNLIFVYLDTSRYIDSAQDEYASLQFWGDLLHAFQTTLDPAHPPKQSLSRSGTSKNQRDKAFEIKCSIEKLISAQKHSVIFALDNFQGIASLPFADSAWLRAMAIDCNCAYIVTSRHLLYLLYHSESWEQPSPLWNLFLDRIYLGLLSEDDAIELILQKGKLASFWLEEDIKFIKKMAGRHPALLRIACALLYEQRQQTRELTGLEEYDEEYDFIESRIYRDGSPICNQLWYGLADPELMGISRGTGYRRDPSKLSAHQKVLIDIVNEGDSTQDHQYLFELEERGLIERAHGKWQVFAGIMHQFILRQEQVRQMGGLAPVYPTADITLTETSHLGDGASRMHQARSSSSTQTMPQPPLTYLEGKVYQYLQSHTEEVCDKEEIKQAIWGEDKVPSDSTLQKIIERIRRKIEPDPDNPRYLIAVRGQGYILRDNQSEQR